MDIVIASNNKHKMEEFRKLMDGYNLVTLNDIGFFDDIIEDGNSFLENALIKANAVYKYIKNKGLDYLIIADDSGLCIPALNGEPGINSARYSGIHDDASANRKKVLDNLDGKNRDAYFTTTIVLMYPNGEYKSFDGRSYGYITDKEYGNTDFGYESIFYSNDLGKTYGEATKEEKNSVSHRGKAIRSMLKELNNEEITNTSITC